MEIILNNEVIPIIINHKKIKNIYFRFDNNCNLIVSASSSIRDKEILNIIKKNSKSLERMLLKVEKKEIKNAEFWYLGNKYDLIYDENITDIILQDKTIISQNKEKLDKFIKEKTKEIFMSEIEEIKKIIKPPEFTLKLRKMKTRWGVCNYKLKTITLNTELIKYNIEDLRYVIVHEMCHFYHHNHGEDFWNMVSKYYPNYKQARKDLRS